MGCKATQIALMGKGTRGPTATRVQLASVDYKPRACNDKQLPNRRRHPSSYRLHFLQSGARLAERCRNWQPPRTDAAFARPHQSAGASVGWCGGPDTCRSANDGDGESAPVPLGDQTAPPSECSADHPADNSRYGTNAIAVHQGTLDRVPESGPGQQYAPRAGRDRVTVQTMAVCGSNGDGLSVRCTYRHRETWMARSNVLAVVEQEALPNGGGSLRRVMRLV